MSETTKKVLFYVAYIGLGLAFGIGGMLLFGQEWGFHIGTGAYIAIVTLVVLFIHISGR